MRENTWAMIEGGVVVNTFIWDGVSEFDFGDQFSYVDISDDKYLTVSIGWKYENGEFIAPPEPPKPEPSQDEIVADAEIVRQNKISAANAIFLVWQTKLLLNMATEEQKESVRSWVNYVDDLKAVNVQQAPNITWPEEPPVPDDAQ
jgi:hypothetical protein